MNPLVLSGSSLNVWTECPRRWEYSYLWVKETPPSFKMALGVAAHEAVEWGLGVKAEEGHVPEWLRWADVFSDAWTAATRLSRPKNDRPEESSEAYRMSGVACVKFYAEKIAPTIEPLMLEEPVAFGINGHVWTGTIDLVQEGVHDDLEVWDHKFTSKRPDDSRRYKRPAIGYVLGLRHKTGRKVDTAVFDYIIRNQKPVRHTVRLVITDQDILDFATEVEEAVTNINAGRFPPIGATTGACRWCPYRRICPDARV